MYNKEFQGQRYLNIRLLFCNSSLAQYLRFFQNLHQNLTKTVNLILVGDYAKCNSFL